MKKILKIWRWFFLILFFFFFSQKIIWARDYKVDYQVEYFLEEKEGRIESPVSFWIKITNLLSSVYVERFILTFPSSFLVKDFKAKDDWGEITPQIEKLNDKIKVTVKFSNPNIGKDSVNNFYLNFYQDNLFKVNGNIWEVILPTIEKEKEDSYKVIVHLPKESKKKIGLAKPKPTYIFDNQIVWENPKEKTLYAVFGDEQYYKTTLYYHLKNERPYPVYTEIALPPDTLYQKVFIEKIDQKPFSVYQDDDGNFLARYLLKPFEKKVIVFDGVISVYTKPRVEIRDFINKKIKDQSKYLLSSKSFWEISEIEKKINLSSLKTVKDIYDFVVDKLNYNQGLVLKKNERKGANLALSYPNQAVCTEFTDLFVALAREKGIFSREVQGYGFTQDEKLRPLTLTSDILHAWPEYYDDEKKIWVPVDPSWQDTSGIDYFSSFDLNHITFVIHGKDPSYPVSAGMYKLEDSSDIVVKPVSYKPKEEIKIGIKINNLPKKIDDKNFYLVNLVLENQSNVSLFGKKITFESLDVNISPKEFLIESFLPFEKKELKIKVNSYIKNKKKAATFNVLFDGKEVFKDQILIIPYYYNLGLKITIGVLFLAILMVLFLKRRYD